MADFAPVYMDVYDEDGTNTPLANLILSANTVAGDAAAGTTIGALTGFFDQRSILEVYGSNLFYVEKSGSVYNLKLSDLGAAAAAGAYPIQVREISQFTDGSPRITNFTITISA